MTAAMYSDDAKTILVVDDEIAARRLVCSILRQDGYSVLEAGDSETATALHHELEGSVDLLLTDVSLGDANGCELAASLREAQPNLQVLFMSGLYAPELEDHGVPKDSRCFLQKPFGMKDLLRRVKLSLELAAATPQSVHA
jgi:DNA-binding response OmpR family regulator